MLTEQWLYDQADRSFRTIESAIRHAITAESMNQARLCDIAYVLTDPAYRDRLLVVVDPVDLGVDKLVVQRRTVACRIR